MTSQQWHHSNDITTMTSQQWHHNNDITAEYLLRWLIFTDRLLAFLQFFFICWYNFLLIVNLDHFYWLSTNAFFFAILLHSQKWIPTNICHYKVPQQRNIIMIPNIQRSVTVYWKLNTIINFFRGIRPHPPPHTIAPPTCRGYRETHTHIEIALLWAPQEVTKGTDRKWRGSSDSDGCTYENCTKAEGWGDWLQLTATL